MKSDALREFKENSSEVRIHGIQSTDSTDLNRA